MFSVFGWFVAGGCGTIALAVFVGAILTAAEDDDLSSVVLMLALALTVFALSASAYLRAIVTGVGLWWGVAP